ncbi:MAG: SpoIID/LytB domain-containing protein [Chlamydiota bacterium]
MILLGLFFLIQSLCAETTLPAKPPEQVKILLERSAQEALLEVKGPYYIFNPKDGTRITSGLLGKRFLVYATPEGIKWGETFLDIHQISVVPRSEGSSLLVNGIQYDGAISIYAKEGEIHIVNELLIEDYVQSRLAQEFSAPLPVEALCAVAILARTSAYYYAKNNTSLWQLDAKEIDYSGSFRRSPGSFLERIVRATKGLILVHTAHGKKEPFPGTWTEHSAGKTAAFSAIFRKESPFPSVSIETPYALNNRKESSWFFSISKEKLAKYCMVKKLERIETFIDPTSKKSYAVRIVGEKNRDFSFHNFQKLLGKTAIQSNDFVVETNDQDIFIHGYGGGDGVGLCLYSACLMAKNGENALDILNKFFPGASLQNLSSKMLSAK